MDTRRAVVKATRFAEASRYRAHASRALALRGPAATS